MATPTINRWQHDADEHVAWLASLSLHDRLRYDRAFGRAWFAGNGKEQCQAIARKAVDRSRHVGPRSTIAPKAEQVYDRAPGALASSPVLALLNASASSPVPTLSACPHAPASSHHVGAGSNASRKAKQVHDRAPGRDGRKHGQDRQHLSTYVNGSFAGTYAEDRDGNSRASSFCFFTRQHGGAHGGKCRMNNDIQRAAMDAARHDTRSPRRT
jgi:hypothetical protein